MKTPKLLLLVAVLGLSVQQAHSQDWSIFGNSISDPNTNWIGTINAKDFRIRTDNAEAVSIDTLGNVGIGTTVPRNLQHLNKVGSTALYTQFTNSTTGSSNSATGFRIGIDANGNAIINSNHVDTNHVHGNMFFSTAGTTPRMTILGAPVSGIPHWLFTSPTARAGNIGIGTTTPIARFDVYETDTLSLNTIYWPDKDTTTTTGDFPIACIAGSFRAANHNAPMQAGVLGQSKYATRNNIGVLGLALDTVPHPNGIKNNTGVHGEAKGSDNLNFGVYGSARYEIFHQCRMINAGVHANADGSTFENRGGSFVTEGKKGYNYSVWARSTHGSPPDDGDSTSPLPRWSLAPEGYAGTFLGDVYVLGSIINQGVDFMPIDSPNGVKPLPGDSALIWLSKLTPESYKVSLSRDTTLPTEFPRDWHMGLDKDSVIEYLPEATRIVYRPETVENKCASNNKLIRDTSIVYNEIIPVLVAGVNRLASTHNSLIWQQSSTRVALFDSTKRVGIGISAPLAKLDVQNTTVRTSIRGVTRSVGATQKIGGAFEAISPYVNGNNIGVYGSANGNAGYFQGNVLTTGTYNGSDINLKDSIGNITNALATLAQLQPKTYVFKTDSFPYMNLPEGHQMGFISQQLDTIPELENLVSEVLQPEILDTDGTVLQDTMTFKALNYTGLIPLVVAGIQEQQALIDSLGEANRWYIASDTLRTVNPTVPVKTGGSIIHTLNSTDRFSVNYAATNPSKVLFHLGDNLQGTAADGYDLFMQPSGASGLEGFHVLATQDPQLIVGRLSSTASTLLSGMHVGNTNTTINCTDGTRTGFINVVNNGNIQLFADSGSGKYNHFRVDARHFYTVKSYTGTQYTTHYPDTAGVVGQVLAVVSKSGNSKRLGYISPTAFGDSVWVYHNDSTIAFQKGTDTLAITIAPNVPGAGVHIANTGNFAFLSGGGEFYFYNDAIQSPYGPAGGAMDINIDFDGDTVVELHSMNIMGGTSKLFVNYDILKSHNARFDGNVGIGVTTPAAKLDVNGTEPVGVQSIADSIGGSFTGNYIGAYGFAQSADSITAGVVGQSENGTFRNYGVAGYTIFNTDTVANHGVLGFSRGSETENIGVVGTAEFEPDMPSALLNVGVSGRAGKSDHQNMGGSFVVEDTIGVNYGMYASAEGLNDYAGYFNGNIAYVGITVDVSDNRLKANVENLESTLAKLSQLEPKDYEFRTRDYPHMNLPEGKQYGLIAQDVEKVFPELVADITTPEIRDSLGKVVSPQTTVKGVNYKGFIPLLINGMKEQQKVIDSLSNELTTRIAAIESRLNNCCGSGGIEYRLQNPEEEEETVHQLSVELNAMQVVVLEQNVPNPFAEQTSISYFVPEDAGAAKMQFTDMRGQVIKSVDLEKGSGVVTVFAQNLGNGTYTYSVLIDGKVVETKRMVKSR